MILFTIKYKVFSRITPIFWDSNYCIFCYFDAGFGFNIIIRLIRFVCDLHDYPTKLHAFYFYTRKISLRMHIFMHCDLLEFFVSLKNFQDWSYYVRQTKKLEM